jgi:hypothetical protein
VKRFAPFMIFVFACVLVASAQDKPRVFVQGKGSEDVNSDGAGGGGRHWGAWGSRSTIDSHDESMEVTKDLQKNCTGVIVTLNQSNADYTVMMNRESKKNRGLLRSNSQVQVANKSGDILGTSATHTVGNAAKDACELIMSDWQTHGRTTATASVPAANVVMAQPAQTVTPAVTLNGAVTAATTARTADAAALQKQRQACLDLAKDNPSIVCK